MQEGGASSTQAKCGAGVATPCPCREAVCKWTTTECRVQALEFSSSGMSWADELGEFFMTCCKVFMIWKPREPRRACTKGPEDKADRKACGVSVRQSAEIAATTLDREERG